MDARMRFVARLLEGESTTKVQRLARATARAMHGKCCRARQNLIAIWFRSAEQMSNSAL
jgi:hypothetical protein